MRSKDVLKEAIRDFDGTVVIVSHDREFLDGLVTKVYEFGGEEVKEHLGGIYDFLQKKKIDSLQELQKSISPSSLSVGMVQVDKPVSQNRLSYEQQKERQKKLRKLEKAVEQCEDEISEIESAIAILETQMATPEGATDMALYERHTMLKKQLSVVEQEWENSIMALEEEKSIQ
jgi:ATP-binding cassette subfamily F protein 3